MFVTIEVVIGSLGNLCPSLPINRGTGSSGTSPANNGLLWFPTQTSDLVGAAPLGPPFTAAVRAVVPGYVIPGENSLCFSLPG